MSAAFRDSFLPSFSFFDLFCTVSLSYVSSNAHRNPATGWWAFGCIVIITVTRYNEDTSRAANKTRDARLLLARGRLSTKPRSTGEGKERGRREIWSEFGRICLVDETTKRSLWKLWTIFGLRGGGLRVRGSLAIRQESFPWKSDDCGT